MSISLSIHTTGRTSATRVREVDGVATAFEPIYSEKFDGRWLLTASSEEGPLLLEDFNHLDPYRIVLEEEESLRIEDLDGGHHFVIAPRESFSSLELRFFPNPELIPAHREALVALFTALADEVILDWKGESIDLNQLKLRAEQLLQSLIGRPGIELSWEPPKTSVELEIVRIGRMMPEAYELFREGQQIGYIRLRHGWLRVHYPDHRSSRPVYEIGTRGDGSFYDDGERETQLRKSAVEILRADGVENPEPIFEIPFYEEEEDLEGSVLDSLEMLKSFKEARLAKAAEAEERT